MAGPHCLCFVPEMESWSLAQLTDANPHFREAFRMFDRNKDGFIDSRELKKVASMLGTMLTKEEVEDFMSQADLVKTIPHYSSQLTKRSNKTSNNL